MTDPRLGQHLGHRHTGIRQTLKCPFRLSEGSLHPLGLLPQPCHLFPDFFSRASSKPSTDGTSHPHKRDEQTNHAHLSRRQPEFMPPSPNQTITFGKRMASQLINEP
ncbi:hypothetical protein, partial [Streptomyces sp. MK7]|uniref:hypothetical protein n=1 Tax=Streptomyces sp. MK7 TaxID=3067635 RepID=UPI0029310C2B